MLLSRMGSAPAEWQLAGSVLTMENALRNASRSTGAVQESWVMSSHNAARAIGIAEHKGSLETGKDADLVLLDADYSVNMTVVEAG